MSAHSLVFTASATQEIVTEKHIAVASELADISGEICRRYFGQSIRIQDKSDGSPVTKADLEIERGITKTILHRFPNHSIFGEEFGLTVGDGEDKAYLWVIDPIDGTLSFITGKPLFTTLIALLYNGQPVLGVIDQPILRDRWIGALGRPTTHNDQSVTARDCKDVSHAYMYSVSPDMFLHHKQTTFDRLSPYVKHHIWGGDSYAYGLLANGLVDIVLDANMKVFDYMALVPIVQGAGGEMTDWSGNAIVWDGVRLNGKEQWPEETMASATPELHAQALRMIDWKKRIN